MGITKVLFGKSAAALVSAAEKHIALTNGLVSVDMNGLKSHLNIETNLVCDDTRFNIITCFKENDAPVAAFGQLLLRGVQADRSVGGRLPRFLHVSTCELLGFSENGDLTAFFSTDHYWRAVLNARISNVDRSLSSTHHKVEISSTIILDLPPNIHDTEALLGVQHAFLQRATEGALGVSRWGAFQVLEKQQHPMVSSQAAEALGRLFNV